jgi:beta-glucanase (GH16 family)
MICFLILNTSFAQTPANDPHWQMKWQDEFNTFDNSKWGKAHYSDHYGEPQLYFKENVWVSNGNLVIKITNDGGDCQENSPFEGSGVSGKCQTIGWHNYTSGWVESETAYNTQFGYIEARINFPFKRIGSKSWGFWPAFWTFVGIKNGTNAAEIDICEIFSGRHKEPNTILTCIHRGYPTSTPPINDANKGVSHVFSNFSYTDWHTYAIEWNVDRIIWYVDGEAIRSFSGHEIVDPVRIILNLALQKESKYYPPTSPSFQEFMYVDYVNVYSLKCDKNTVINEISNFNTYNYAVKKSITMSNATTIPAGSNITLRATDFIELETGFEIQTGRELYLDVTPCVVQPNNVRQQKED